MARILIYAAGTISAGEITIASKFASGLDPNEHSTVYILPCHYEKVLDERAHKFLIDPKDGPQKNKSIIYSIVKNFNPDYILLADPYTCHFASSWSGINFDGFKTLGVSLIGLDEYNYASEQRRVDYYGGVVTRCRDILNECSYIIQDVPTNQNYSDAKNIWQYSLFSEEEMSGAAAGNKELLRRQLKDDLRIPERGKLVFLPVSAWEYVNMHRLPILEGFINELVMLVVHYVNEVCADCIFVHIGKYPAKVSCDELQLEYLHFSSMNSETYNKIIDASDLFITFNTISVSLSRAVLHRIPSIAFVNEKMVDFVKLGNSLQKLPAWYQKIAESIQLAYPYSASTFGWREFLKPLFKNNKYFNLFIRAPVFSYSKAKEAIRTALCDPMSFAVYNRGITEYIEQLLKLKSPAEIMKEICNSTEQLVIEYKTENGE